ncbi:MAG: hypothetical protein CL464_02040 [Acidimicrobiaceae bacterium]|nr:hypothetical protein [Acidimicrobiaceae bacterium]
MPYAFEGVELVGDSGDCGPVDDVESTRERCLPGVLGAVDDEQGSPIIAKAATNLQTFLATTSTPESCVLGPVFLHKALATVPLR